MLDILKLIAVTQPTGATVHQENDFSILLEPKLRKVFFETYDEVPEQYSQIFNVLSSTKAQEFDYHLGAMGEWNELGTPMSTVANGTDMPSIEYSKIHAGNQVIYTHHEFARGFMVERKFMDDEQYGVIEKFTADLSRAGRYKVENDAFAVLNNAFTNVGYDGKALIAEDHPLIDSPKTVSNRIYSTTFDSATIQKALTLGRNQLDNAGKKVQMKFDTIVVPPALEWKAYEILNSALKAGTNNNDKNVLSGILNVKVVDFLTSDTAWFLMDSKRHQLNFFWRVKPEFGREKDFDTLVSKYSGYMRYSAGYSDFRGVIGCDGVSTDPTP